MREAEREAKRHAERAAGRKAQREAAREAKLLGGQILQRIDRRALASDFEMQPRGSRVGLPHFGDFGALLDILSSFNQQDLVVRVGRDEPIVMVDNHQVAQATHAVSCVHDFAVGSSFDRVAWITRDVDAFGASGKP